MFKQTLIAALLMAGLSQFAFVNAAAAQELKTTDSANITDNKSLLDKANSANQQNPITICSYNCPGPKTTETESEAAVKAAAKATQNKLKQLKFK